jgi:site-specific recombinase XerD
MSPSAEHAIVSDLVARFLEHGVYLRGWSPKTRHLYGRIFKRFTPADLTKASLHAFVLSLQPLNAGGRNLHCRAVNAFLSWAHEEGHTPERLRVKLLRNAPRPIDLLTDADVSRLLAFRPKSVNQRRAWTLTMVLLDTGLRISEVLGLERANVNLDDCVLRVLGKGHKERLVPFSVEARKHLFRWMRQAGLPGRYVFGVRTGGRMTYRNAHRDIAAVCSQLGIRAAVNPHAFRHAFAVNYVRAGGDIYRLSRILGHSSLATTQIYLRSMGIEHLKEGHHSPLSR